MKQQRRTIYVVGGRRRRGGGVALNATCLLNLKYDSIFFCLFVGKAVMGFNEHFCVSFFFASHQVAACCGRPGECNQEATHALLIALYSLHFGFGPHSHQHNWVTTATFAPQKLPSSAPTQKLKKEITTTKHTRNKQTRPESVCDLTCFDK